MQLSPALQSPFSFHLRCGYAQRKKQRPCAYNMFQKKKAKACAQRKRNYDVMNNNFTPDKISCKCLARQSNQHPTDYLFVNAPPKE